MFRLELKLQNLTVKEYRLQDGDTRFVGRAPENHIVVDDLGVSRNHACISQMDHQLFIWDEGSKHGTLVNGVPVICANLKHGDLISIGMNHTLKASVTTKDREGTLSAFFDDKLRLMTTT